MTLYLGSTRVALTAVPTRFGAAPATFIGDVDSNGVLQAPATQTNLVFTGVQNIGNNGLYYGFAFSPTIKSASFPDLTTLTGATAMYHAFDGTPIESVSFPVLETIATGGRVVCGAFFDCTSLTSVSFPALTNFNAGSGGYSFFEGCSSLASVSFPVLARVVAAYGFYSAFRDCTSLTTMTFPALAELKGNQAFAYAFRDISSMRMTA